MNADIETTKVFVDQSHPSTCINSITETESKARSQILAKWHYRSFDSKKCIRGFYLDSNSYYNTNISGLTYQLPIYYAENSLRLLAKFDIAANLPSYSNQISKGNIQQLFDYTAQFISELPFDKCTVEIGEFENLKYTLIFDENKELMISVDSLSNNAAFSFFIKNELILSDVTEITRLINGFKEYFNL